MRRILQLLAAVALATPVLPVSAMALPDAKEVPAVANGVQPQAAEEVGTEEKVTALVYPARTATISRPGAWYVKVHLTELTLLPGAEITVSNVDGTEVYRYTADGGLTATPTETGFWAMSITGDTAVVTVHGRGWAAVDKITRGFTAAEFAARPQPMSVCGTNDWRDVVCFRTSNPTEYANTRPVARLLRNGSSLCTGWRVGPNNRMLTNNHCFTSPTGIEVWFNYDCTTCGGTVAATTTKVLASQVLRTNVALDYTLFTVNNFAAIQGFGSITLDTRRPVVGEQMYIVQHPGGQMKKLGLRDSSTTTGFCQVRAVGVNGSSAGADISYMCDTIGGSSGSVVMSRTTHRAIALHHFGGCPNQGVRVELIEPQIRSLL
ncbi:MAG TPA: serine protease [Actinophytocola sp.]|uniref:trypsin-like serine peptidase n=1 Tax=Actinophytocola sp. TaxID=1872138 RepID=UPI002DC04EAE|nr:serine protease [Actinophytocola sp.]HEU5473419.1 serine protease [Actinophytocola sp.]